MREILGITYRYTTPGDASAHSQQGCCKYWHHLRSKSNISLSFGRSASGFLSNALMFITRLVRFRNRPPFLDLLPSSFSGLPASTWSPCSTHQSVLSNTAFMGLDTLGGKHTWKASGKFGARNKDKNLKNLVCEYANNSTGEKFRFNHDSEWLHGLKISCLRLKWPMHNSHIWQGRNKKAANVQTQRFYRGVIGDGHTSNTAFLILRNVVPMVLGLLAPSTAWLDVRHLLFFRTWGWMCTEKIL